MLYYPLFVYGSLKKGQIRSSLLAKERYLGIAHTAENYKLFKLPHFPGLVETAGEPGQQIVGELYEVDDNCLIQLDDVECVSHNLFKRVKINLASHVLSFLPLSGNVFKALEKHEAITYLYCKEVDSYEEISFWSKIP